VTTFAQQRQQDIEHQLSHHYRFEADKLERKLGDATAALAKSDEILAQSIRGAKEGHKSLVRSLKADVAAAQAEIETFEAERETVRAELREVTAFVENEKKAQVA
jgi:seryl-tRNA synthetase